MTTWNTISGPSSTYYEVGGDFLVTAVLDFLVTAGGDFLVISGLDNVWASITAPSSLWSDI